MLQDNKFDLAKSELQLVQGQIDKYDELSAKIKTWTLTLWAALLGWSFQVGRKEVLYLGILIVLFLWGLDAVNKNFRQHYKNRKMELIKALQVFLENSSWPGDFVSPAIVEHEGRDAVRKIFRPHVLLFYAPLIIVTLFIIFVV